MDSAILESLGLNTSQAATYLFLLKHGKQTAAEMAKGTGETRTNTYNLLDQLISLGLVDKLSSTRTNYRAKSPTALRQLLVKRTQEVSRINTELSSLLPSLLTTYRISHNQPGVVHAEGHEAFQVIYDDVIRTRETPLIFASSKDRDDTETAAIIDEQIERQNQAGIASKVLIPKNVTIDDASGVSVRAKLHQPLPAQIMVYGDNVAFTTFTNGVSSTVISNPEIAATMRTVFDQLWA